MSVYFSSKDFKINVARNFTNETFILIFKHCGIDWPSDDNAIISVIFIQYDGILTGIISISFVCKIPGKMKRSIDFKEEEDQKKEKFFYVVCY